MQKIVVFVLLILSILYILKSLRKKFAGKSCGDGGCGCDKK